ncbi:putative casparian strip membrane protein [Helianthus annuus]|uniref:CASP-like protein n=1 Tax=Helianthus annuus TaxID=4232 RepID=A0A251S5Z7_HELAN|nr:CASP-like protein 2B1 [Helianthus annuus]KAF5763338.1 putative casparian strip membrane protein [Helianthus annuus]KAJ0454239.1 putative casparian strip membrane protein [Helianthus annuus]KAJ0472010.1 putative casparian strip membrane protein [Helianthus annuus]KAJ0651482.1 putative casparian strip membrane protein [Helianthus annuus]KAJ0692113.1 putative casparian strip membrane protein [Helianthus annuus]
MSYLGVGVSPGKYAAGSKNDSKAIDRKVRLAELILRTAVCGLALVAALLVATDTQVKEIFTIRKKAKFTDMKSLVMLVVVNGVAAAYSLVQTFRCVVGMVRGSVLFNKPLAWLIFSADQVMAYMIVAAIGAAAQSAAFAKLGEPQVEWMKVCDMYGKFCTQVGEGIASSVLACASMIIVSAISAFSLFRLYAGNKAW